MKVLATIALLALATNYVSAECNNMCSGHGICGANDACTCYRNWRGNDCSERTCQYGVAFVDTAQGDLNHNGLIDAKTVGVKTQWSPTADTFEEYFNFDSAEEAHAYMECSNKGLCDRSSGECVCFDGYEGSACQRTVCHNSCSGHGVCRNVIDKSQALSTTAKYSYPLWDGLKNQACVCDPGYSGVDCRQRDCPKGADPLIDEVVVSGNIRSVANEHQTLTFTGATGSTTNNIVLQYTDLFGETWTTASIAVTTDGTPAISANGIAAGLTGIPNSVIEQVSVSCAALVCTVDFTNNPGVLNLITVKSASDVTPTVATVDQNTGGSPKVSNAAVECSNRGLCDYETGLCKCFRGYRLDDCSAQHALAYGSSVSA